MASYQELQDQRVVHAWKRKAVGFEYTLWCILRRSPKYRATPLSDDANCLSSLFSTLPHTLKRWTSSTRDVQNELKPLNPLTPRVNIANSPHALRKLPPPGTTGLVWQVRVSREGGSCRTPPASFHQLRKCCYQPASWTVSSRSQSVPLCLPKAPGTQARNSGFALLLVDLLAVFIPIVFPTGAQNFWCADYNLTIIPLY